MALSQSTQSRKRYYHFLLLLIVAGGIGIVLLYGYRYYLERETVILDQKIAEQEHQISKLLSDNNFKNYLEIQKLENKRQQLPRSEYVHRILEILDSIKAVEESRGGVELSDFKVDLEKLSLNGVVSNLRVLYGNRLGKGGLIDSFNKLEFLSDITIRKYQKIEENNTFEFTLSANVITNATTGSTTHQ